MTKIILKKNKGGIEIHIEGDAVFLNGSDCFLFDMMQKDVDIIAFSSEFKKDNYEKRNKRILRK